MQVRLSKLLVSSIIIGTFLLFVVHTFYYSYGNVWTTDYDAKIEPVESAEFVFQIPDGQEKRIKFQMPVAGERNIIFLETTCILNSTGYIKETSKLQLNAEKACAIESAAKANPNASVYLFYSCPLEPESLGRSDELVKRIFYYPNVHVWHQSMDSVFTGSPLEKLYTSGKISSSRFPRTHGSDVLRYLMLWTFGGIYLDLDFIVQRSFDPLGPNFVGAESWNNINSAALGLASYGLGAQIAQQCLEELRTDFRGDEWGYNGPGVITRIMTKRCGVEKTQEMTLEKCGGFSVLQMPFFYPIFYEQWRLFYTESNSNSTMLKLAPATAVHVWNSMKVLDADKTPVTIKRGSQQPIALLHEEFCPSVNQLMIDEEKTVDGSVVQTR